MASRELYFSANPFEHVDPRICPADQVIPQTVMIPGVTAEEAGVINHAHGVVGDFITGPDEVKVAIGLRTLSDVDNFYERIIAQTEAESAKREPLDGETFATLVSSYETRVSRGMIPLIDKLWHEDKQAYIMPAIVNHYALSMSFPGGVIEDLSQLVYLRAIGRQAYREGLARMTSLVMKIHVGDMLNAHKYEGTSPGVTLESYDSDEEVTGRLTGIHSDVEGGHWLELREADGSKRRVPHGPIKLIGVTVGHPPVDEPGLTDAPHNN